MKLLTLFALAGSLTASSVLVAQCPVITSSTAIVLTCTNSPLTLTATSNYSANISSRWFFNNQPMLSFGTSTSTTYLNAPGTYIVEFTDNVSNCIVGQTITVIAPSKPYFDFTVSSPTAGCSNSPVTFSIINAQAPGGGALTYAIGPMTSPPVYGVVNSYTASGCGYYHLFVKDVASGCVSSYTTQIICMGSTPLPAVTILSDTDPVCVGSPASLSAFGANTYTWNTGATSALINVTPNAPTFYLVTGVNQASCPNIAYVQAVDCHTATAIGEHTPDENLADVFPNPAAGQLHVRSTLHAAVQYSLYDVSGRQIGAGSFTGQAELDLSRLERGIYLLRFSSGGRQLHKKIVLE